MKSFISLSIEILSELASYVTFRRFSVSLTLVLLLNLVPFIGLFWLEWHPLLIFFIYWFESMTIGLYNLFKMVVVAFYLGYVEKSFSTLVSGLGFAGFFMIHFFGFCLVHLAFMPSSEQGNLSSIIDYDILYSIGIIVLSHGFSTIRYFFFEREYRQYRTRSIVYQMLPPYARVMTLHLTLVGGHIFGIFDNATSILSLMLLMGFKTIADTVTHYFEHREQLKPQRAEQLGK